MTSRHTRPMEKERKMTAPGVLLSRSPRSFIGASCVYSSSSSPGSEKSKRMGRNKTTERGAVTSSTQLTLLCVCVIFSLGQPNKRDVREQQNCNKKVRARLCRHCFQTPSIIIIIFFLFFILYDDDQDAIPIVSSLFSTRLAPVQPSIKFLALKHLILCVDDLEEKFPLDKEPGRFKMTKVYIRRYNNLNGFIYSSMLFNI